MQLVVKQDVKLQVKLPPVKMYVVITWKMTQMEMELLLQLSVRHLIQVLDFILQNKLILIPISILLCSFWIMLNKMLLEKLNQLIMEVMVMMEL